MQVYYLPDSRDALYVTVRLAKLEIAVAVTLAVTPAIALIIIRRVPGGRALIFGR